MIGKRIRELRNALPMNQVEFANFLNIKQNTLSVYEKRGKVPAELLESIVIKTNVNPDWLLTGRGEIFGLPSLIKEVQEKLKLAVPVIETTESISTEQQDKNLSFSCIQKHGRELEGGFLFIDRLSTKATVTENEYCFEIIEKIPILKRLVSSYPLDKIKCIEVLGNSMEPEYKHGSLALYVEGDIVHSDDDYVINSGGELTLKTVQFERNDLLLISRNPLYPSKRISKDEQCDISIAGRVIGKLEVR